MSHIHFHHIWIPWLSVFLQFFLLCCLNNLYILIAILTYFNNSLQTIFMAWTWTVRKLLEFALLLDWNIKSYQNFVSAIERPPLTHPFYFWKKNSKSHSFWKYCRTKLKFYHSCHCVKSVQIGRFFWSVFSCIRTEYGDLRGKSSFREQVRINIIEIFGEP